MLKLLFPTLRRSCHPLAWAAATFFGAALLANPAPAITGVCPDGSIFIVQSAKSIPCARAKEVEPGEVPPMRPEYLPQPYTWRVYNEANNPNNPYNLIDAAREIRALRDAAAGASAATTPGFTGGGGRAGAGAETAAARTPVGPLDLGLADDELRDLYLIVELLQEHAPATFRRETADRRGVFDVRLAHSGAFEERLHQAWQSRGGLAGSRVVLFTAASKQAEAFHANFTFVQDHLSYQPKAQDARQLGLLQGRLGDLAADEWVLGYVVLPETIDLARPLDVYWNDRHLEVQF